MGSSPGWTSARDHPTARDWLAKLHLVTAGSGVTTMPASVAAIAPPGVRVLAAHSGSQEQRRVILARLPHLPLTEPAVRLADALRAGAADVPAPR
jgi:DNA-binding transcriptional LysR family regulator